MEIQHRKGASHGNADALSRRPCREECKHCSQAEKKEQLSQESVNVGQGHGGALQGSSGAVLSEPASERRKTRSCKKKENNQPNKEAVRQITTKSTTPEKDPWCPEALYKAQNEDPDLKLIVAWKEKSGSRPTWQEVAHLPPSVKKYWTLWDSLHLRDGVLYRKWENEDGKTSKWQLVVPHSRIPAVLREIHNSPTGGHFGVYKTLNKVRDRFYWTTRTQDVERWCKECHDCNARKGPKVRTRARLQRYNVGAPFERLALDILGPLPRSDNGNRYILVVMDYFTKWPEAYAIPDQEASTVADALTTNWICRFGVPMLLHSDQGTNFNSNLFMELCKLLGIEKTRTTPLRPQSDGMVERFNRTILNHLSLFVSKNQQDWDRYLPLFLMAYRSAVHESTGYSPAEMMFGKSLRLPLDLLYGRPDDAPSSPDDYVRQLQARLEEVHRFARERINFVSDKMKTRYDVKSKVRDFKEGDRVWLYNPVRRRGLSPKLQKPWDGPYTIAKKQNDVVLHIQKSPGAKRKIVHIDRLAPYFGEVSS